MTPQAHWITANHGSRYPRRFTYVQALTETTPTEHGAIETWVGAVCAHRGATHKTASKRGLAWQAFDQTDDLWRWIAERTENRSRTVVVAHGVSTLLRVSNALPAMIALGWVVAGIRLDDGSTYVQWRKGERTLIVVDLVAWIAEPMATIVDLLDGYDRADRLPPPWETGARRRAAENVSVIATAWETLLQWCEAEDLGNWHPTGAGQAWAAWRHRFMPTRVLCHDLADVRAHERASVYCGRTEAFRHGHLPGARWVELDFARAYVAICRDAWLPSKYMWTTDRVNLDRVMAAPPTYRYLLDVTVTTDRPSVPWRDGRGICWPVGEFRSWLWHDEARLVLADGGTLKVHRAHVYRGAQVLAEWARWVDQVLDGHVPSAGPLERRAVKHWGRALVGRFGAQWSDWDPWGEPLDCHVGVTRVVDVSTGERYRLLAAGGPLLAEGPKSDGADTAPSLMSAVMSATRVKMDGALRSVARPGDVAHCDTDGLIVAPRAALRVMRANPGLRIKAEWLDLTVLGPRQLHGDRGVHIAGLARGASAPVDGRSVGVVRQGMAAALASGDHGHVVVTRRVWSIRGVDNRRRHLPNGLTAPITVNGGRRVG